MLEPVQQHMQQRRQPEAEQDRVGPRSIAIEQHPVDEYRGQYRIDQTWNHHEKTSEHQKDERRAVTGQVFERQPVHVFRLAGRLELRSRLHRQDHAGERLVELVVRHPAPAACRVIDIGTAPVKALEHHKMVEVPEHDAGQLHRAQIGRFLLVTPGGQAVGAGRLEDVARLAAVPRHAAFLA